jgi:hypothetical protein
VGEVPVDDDDRAAVDCCARAMDHATTMASDPTFRWSTRVILDLHFDTCWFQADRRPGLWRTGAISVTMPDGGGPAFVGPDADDVPALVDEVVDWLASEQDAYIVVRAAMAHLNLVSVHPFEDGNGRVSRVVQSLVLGRDGVLGPDLASIEDYLGRNTRAYYDVLRLVQGGSSPTCVSPASRSRSQVATCGGRRTRACWSREARVVLPTTSRAARCSMSSINAADGDHQLRGRA